jgi:twitching motility protein PilT
MPEESKVQEIYIDELLSRAIKEKASDVHLTVNLSPIVRVSGKLKPLTDYKALTEDQLKIMTAQVLNEEQLDLFFKQKDIDVSYEVSTKERFRVNIFFERGNIAMAFRLIPVYIPTLAELNLPNMLYSFCSLPQGMNLITGPAGVGKSTTLASMMNWINQNKNAHIVTIEDPVEYRLESNQALIHQRELHSDTNDWGRALKAALREDINILLVGETRDTETMQLTMKAAETGHLVFTTLHAYSASQAVERVLSLFPEGKQDQARMQLSLVLNVIITQTLVKGIDESKRYPALEILIATDAVRNTIREGNAHHLNNIINTGYEQGMISMERSLANLVNNGLVTIEEASYHAKKIDDFVRFLDKTKRK